MINTKIFDGLHGFETPKEKHPSFCKTNKEKIFDGLHGFETPKEKYIPFMEEKIKYDL